MIFTASPFLNEVDLMLVKCHILKGVVAGHIIVEADRTFTGVTKPRHFQTNAEVFARYNIHYTAISLPEFALSPWEREAEQYRAVFEAAKRVCTKDDIVIWCDADEIPRPDVGDRFLALGVPTAVLEMDQLMYQWGLVDPTLKWRNSRIGWFDPKADHQPWRGDDCPVTIPDGGWHCEFFGSRATLLEKMDATSHAVEEPCKRDRAEMARGQRPGSERLVPYPREKLPQL